MEKPCCNACALKMPCPGEGLGGIGSMQSLESLGNLGATIPAQVQSIGKRATLDADGIPDAQEHDPDGFTDYMESTGEALKGAGTFLKWGLIALAAFYLVRK